MNTSAAFAPAQIAPQPFVISLNNRFFSCPGR
jgi:hypothetical protein